MKIAICYPPLPSEKGVPLLSQNRQFQWFSRPTYIFPVVPATAATMLKQAGHEVAWLDGIAEEWTPEDFSKRLAAFAPDLVVPFVLSKLIAGAAGIAVALLLTRREERAA